MRPSSLVQRTLRRIAIYEAYYGDVVSWLFTEPEKPEAVGADMLTDYDSEEQQASALEELPEPEELFSQRVRRRFPFIDELEEIDVRDLYRQCTLTSRQLEG
ncbi:hypothetical protein ACFLXE_03945 [Chloroflexota bacterium]